MGSKKTIYHNINFIKLILVLVIVYYHIIAGKLCNIYTDCNFYFYLKQKISYTGYYSVFLLFIISGIFLYKTCNNINFNFKEVIYKKFIRIWPVLTFSSLLCLLLPFIILNYHPEIQTMILNLFFIHKVIGLAQFESWNGVSWFVCALFWNSVIFCALACCIKSNMNRNLLIGNLFLIFFLIVNNNTGNYNTLYFNFLPRELILSFCAMSFGYLLCPFICSEKKYFLKNSSVNFIFYTTLEIILTVLIFLPLILSTNEIKEPILY